MDENKLLLPTHYIRQIAEELETQGINSNDWLNKYGLNKEQLSDPNQTISLYAYKSLVLDAISLTKQPSLALLVSKRIGVTAHGMLGYAVIASSCLRETVNIISRYLDTRQPLIRIELIGGPTELEVHLHPCYSLDKIENPFLESSILVLYNMLMQVTQNDAPITKIYLPFPEPKYTDLYAEIFDFEIIFNAKTACIGLINSKLDTPLAMANKNSLQQAKQICEQELEKLQLAQLLQTRIRKHLLSFKDGFPSLIDVSQYFNMSSRNLHRQLQKEGTSFSTILMSVRKFVAIELLNNSAMTVQAIALTLGYSDIANFRKAFKQWTGVAPSNFRAKN
ncbi:MAG: AraC family transcriptional regulator [Bermanella sp.]